MKRQLTIITLLLFITVAAHAQDLLKGSVVDGTNTRMSNIFVRNLTNNQMSLTDKNGNFAIRAAAGHLLTFTSPTYITDTLYVTDLRPKRIKMVSESISLNEVNISARRLAFDPQTDYRQVYEKAKVYPLSPSSWFGREAKNARRLKRYFKHEVQEREIDQVFTAAYVSSIVPLKGSELNDFMTLYRPSYDFIKGNTERTVALYINDSYKKYMALPPAERKLERLSQ
ncbi:MAG: hypothetical protein EOP51_23050 [Sphingobacteriales bacterium]|nr:MAG: hypothetical protein EOP51_23050 [Sphingobacteriales bacterium]